MRTAASNALLRRFGSIAELREAEHHSRSSDCCRRRGYRHVGTAETRLTSRSDQVNHRRSQAQYPHSSAVRPQERRIFRGFDP